MTRAITEIRTFRQLFHAVVTGEDCGGVVDRLLSHPLPEDEALLATARRANLDTFEMLSLGLAAVAESDPEIGELIARQQSPVGRSRPLAGFLAVKLKAVLGQSPRLVDLVAGNAAALGIIEFGPATNALAESAISVPLHLCGALAGIDVFPAEARLLTSLTPLPPAVTAKAIRHAAAMRDGQLPSLVVRGFGEEPDAAIIVIAQTLNRRPVLLDTAKIPALGPWLESRRLVPVQRLDLAPGETASLDHIPGYTGPRLVSAGPQGAVTIARAPSVEWRIGMPTPTERRGLWELALPDHSRFTAPIAGSRRYGTSRIHQLGTLLRQFSAIDNAGPCTDMLHRASWIVERQALGQLAEAVDIAIDDTMFIVKPAQMETLNRIVRRCRQRERITESLGPAARAAFRPGVRMLFSGPPGTGKSLGAAWLATKLHLPLFRVDLATISSKYIGETEKNLARLFDQAEQSEVVLLFDEADALFSRRTGVHDSHDKFANAQTNYLLERMESFAGIAILTTNNDGNIDTAFLRRLDFCLEFTNPGPQERRALWLSHLGEKHTLENGHINRLAALLDWSGGHIRNAVLHAASIGGPIGWDEILSGVKLEAAKLRVTLPIELLDGG